MAKRKPDRIDRAAWDIALTARDRCPEIPLEKAIAALVRRELKRERKAMREVLVVVEGRWGKALRRWLDEREAGR